VTGGLGQLSVINKKYRFLIKRSLDLVCPLIVARSPYACH